MARTDSNGDYVYPLIPKKYFRAVMYADALIKKHHTFNWACSAAAKYYRVDVEEVRKHVTARAAAGRSYAARWRKGQG